MSYTATETQTVYLSAQCLVHSLRPLVLFCICIADILSKPAHARLVVMQQHILNVMFQLWCLKQICKRKFLIQCLNILYHVGI